MIDLLSLPKVKLTLTVRDFGARANGRELSCGALPFECFCARNSMSYRGALAIINLFVLERGEFAPKLEPSA
jgi:hypothetical protein